MPFSPVRCFFEFAPSLHTISLAPWMPASPVFHGTAVMRIFKQGLLDELGVGRLLGVGQNSILIRELRMLNSGVMYSSLLGNAIRTATSGLFVLHEINTFFRQRRVILLHCLIFCHSIRSLPSQSVIHSIGRLSPRLLNIPTKHHATTFIFCFGCAGDLLARLCLSFSPSFSCVCFAGYSITSNYQSRPRCSYRTATSHF